MKPYLRVAGMIALLILMSFLLVEAWGVSLLSDPSEWIGRGGLLAASVGGGLLMADIFIPVPSSIIMVAHGAVFGLWGGFMLSLVASVIGWMIGWWLGKKGSVWMDRVVSPTEREKARQYMLRYGMLAIVLSRMLPIVAETVAIMTGAMGLGWKRVLPAFTLGTIPPALIYAWAGAMAVDLATGLWIAGGVFVLAGVSWYISQRLLSASELESDAEAEAVSEGS